MPAALKRLGRRSAWSVQFISMCFAVCRSHPQGHVAMYPSTCLSTRKALRPIFSVRIYVINELIDLLRPTWSYERFRPMSSCDGDLTLSAGIALRYVVYFLF